MKLESNKWYETSTFGTGTSVHDSIESEIGGRILVVVYKNGSAFCANKISANWNSVRHMAQELSSQFMLIDPKQEETLEYKGMKPGIIKGEKYVQLLWMNGYEEHIFRRESVSEVIQLWNAFVRSVK